MFRIWWLLIWIALWARSWSFYWKLARLWKALILRKRKKNSTAFPESRSRSRSRMIYQNKADCVWVGRRRFRAKGNPRFEPFENRVLRVAQTWLNGISPRLENFAGQLKRNQLQKGPAPTVSVPAFFSFLSCLSVSVMSWSVRVFKSLVCPCLSDVFSPICPVPVLSGRSVAAYVSTISSCQHFYVPFRHLANIAPLSDHRSSFFKVCFELRLKEKCLTFIDTLQVQRWVALTETRICTIIEISQKILYVYTCLCVWYVYTENHVCIRICIYTHKHTYPCTHACEHIFYMWTGFPQKKQTDIMGCLGWVYIHTYIHTYYIHTCILQRRPSDQTKPREFLGPTYMHRGNFWDLHTCTGGISGTYRCIHAYTLKYIHSVSLLHDVHIHTYVKVPKTISIQ